MTPDAFVSKLADVRLDSVFNPYGEHCVSYDRADAAHLRRQNLKRFLQAALNAQVETMWIARDLGYRGGRRTGIPLTDELHLNQAASLLGGIRLNRATQGPVVAERTAAVIWRALRQIGQPVMLWNVFPFHPHEPNAPLSNRCHTRLEREATWSLMQALVGMIRPKRVIAIGRDAYLSLQGLGVDTEAVRHPSYGGQAEFSAGMLGLYGVAEARDEVAPTPELPFAIVGGAAKLVVA